MSQRKESTQCMCSGVWVAHSDFHSAFTHDLKDIIAPCFGDVASGAQRG